MARHIAKNLIKHSGKTFQPGESVTGLTKAEMAELEAAGAIEVATNVEPSVKDDIEAWREFLVEQGTLTRAQASAMSKEQLFIAYTAGEEADEVSGSIDIATAPTDESPSE